MPLNTNKSRPSTDGAARSDSSIVAAAQPKGTPSITSLGRPVALIAGIAALAGTALAVRANARATERRNPPTGQFLTVNGVHLHYTDTGGPGLPVVLLHGNGMLIADMEISGLVANAAQGHRVIAFDRPGFGYSSRPRTTLWTPAAQAQLFREAFVQLGINSPIVVAHSFGTLVALGLALEHRDSIGGLVLISGYYFPTLRMDAALSVGPAIPLLGDLMRYTVSPLLGRLFGPMMMRKAFAPRPITPQFSTHFPIEMTLRPWQMRASAEEGAMMIPAAAGFQHRYNTIQMPVIIIAGAGDKIVNASQSESLSKEIPNSLLWVLPDLGHMLHHFVADEVTAAIETLSEGTSPTARVAA